MKAGPIIAIAIVLLFSASVLADESDLRWCTFLGSEVGEDGLDIAVGDDGAVYVTGYTTSSRFPTTSGAFDTSYSRGDRNAFVAKLSPYGAELAYCTYLGGGAYTSDAQEGWGIEVDDAGNAYVAGWTNTSDFPITPGAFDTTFNGHSDVFAVKLNRWGTALHYATFLGGRSEDYGLGLALGDDGSVYIAGSTTSDDFPVTPGAHDTTYSRGNYDAFVARLNASGDGLVYASYIGGLNWEHGMDVAVDKEGDAYVTGGTGSVDLFTTEGALDRSLGGDGDGFVVRLNSLGSAADYATYLGGADWDQSDGIAVDDMGCAYLTGSTKSADFPTTAGAFDRTYDGISGDAFVIKLNPAGSALEYGAYLGGSAGDYGHDIAVDGAGRAYLIGETSSEDFPTTPEAFDESFNGGFDDVFIAVVHPWAIALEYATFLGGSDIGDRGNGIAVVEDFAFCITGKTYSEDFPVTAGAFDNSYNGTWDVFVAKFILGDTPVDCEPVGSGLPSDYTLFQNYPNPFNPATEIQYTIPRDGHVILKVYNVQGAEVATLVDVDRKAGRHSTHWDAGDLASGVYFCTMTAGTSGGFRAVRKMVLMK